MNTQRVSPAVRNLRAPLDHLPTPQTSASDVYPAAGPAPARPNPPTPPELEAPRAPRYRAPKPMSRAWFIAAVTVEAVGAAACLAATWVTPFAAAGAAACVGALVATVAAWRQQSGLRQMLRMDDPSNPVLARALGELPMLSRAAAAQHVTRLVRVYRFESPVEAMRTLLPLAGAQREQICRVACTHAAAAIRQDDLQILTRLHSRALRYLGGAHRLPEDWLGGCHGDALANRVRWLNEDPLLCLVDASDHKAILVLMAFESAPNAPSLRALRRIWESLQDLSRSLPESAAIAVALASAPSDEHAQILQAFAGDRGTWLLKVPLAQRLPMIEALARAPGPGYPAGPWNLLQHVPTALRFDAMRAVSLTVPSARPTLLEIFAATADPGPLIADVLHTASTQCFGEAGTEAHDFLHGMLHDAHDDATYAAIVEAIQTLSQACRQEYSPYYYSIGPDLLRRLQQCPLAKLMTLPTAARLETLQAMNTVMTRLSFAQVVTILTKDFQQDEVDDAVRIRSLTRYIADLDIGEATAQQLQHLLTTGSVRFTEKIAHGMERLLPLVRRWSINERNAALGGFSANAQHSMGSIVGLRPRRDFSRTNDRHCAFAEGLMWAVSHHPAAPIPEVNASNPWDRDQQRTACIAALAGQPLPDMAHPLIAWAAKAAGYDNLAAELARHHGLPHEVPYLRGTPSIGDARAALTAWGGHGPLPQYLRAGLIERFAPQNDVAMNAESLHNIFAYCDSLALPPQLDSVLRVAVLEALSGTDRVLSQTVHASFECIGCTEQASEHVQLVHCSGAEKLCNGCATQSIQARPELTTCHTHGAPCSDVALTRDYMHRIGVPHATATQQRERHYRALLRRVPEFNLDPNSATLRGTQAPPVRVGPNDVPPVPSNLTRLQRTHLRLLLSGLGAWPNRAGNGVHRECYQCGTSVQKGDACLHMTCETGTKHDWDFEHGVFVHARFADHGVAAQNYIPLGQGQLASHRFYEALPRGPMTYITAAQVSRRRRAWLQALGGEVQPTPNLAINEDGTLTV